MALNQVTLFVSSPTCSQLGPLDIVAMFPRLRCQVQATANRSRVGAEMGFEISFFDVLRPEVLQAWEFLRRRLALTCAYCRTADDYRGCILNWPGVTRPSLCPRL